MALDWNRIIAVSDDGSVDSFGIERIVLVTGQKGDKGDKGDSGSGAPVWGNITGRIGDQTDLASSLAGKANANDVYSKAEIDEIVDGIDIPTLDDYYTKTQTDGLLANKQNTLTFDNTPTANSNNPVKSGGIKTALDAKQNALTFDSTPTANSTNPVTSGGIKTALDAKQNTLTFDNAPTANSNNPVKSSGIKTALDAKANLASPAFTGTPTAPTPSSGDNSTKLATTAFVQNAVESGGGSTDAVWGQITGTLSEQTDLSNALNAKANANDVYSKTDVDDMFDDVQDKLTFDNTPTANSDNPVKSGGIYTALSGKANTNDVYSKSQVYTKTETDTFIDDLQDQIDDINSFNTHICASGEYNPSTLVPTIANPDASTFYLVPSGSGNDMYDEWVYVNNAWEKFGSARIDLTAYYTKSETDALLDDKADSADLGDLATKDTINWNTDIDNIPQTFPPTAHTHDDRYYTETETDSLLDDKADSADVYTKTETDSLLDDKVDSADLGDLATKDTVNWSTDIDNIPQTFPPSSHTHDDRYYTESETDTLLSTKANSADVYSKTATDNLLDAKQDLLTFDNTPTANSTNPVTSDGIVTAIDAIDSSVNSAISKVNRLEEIVIGRSDAEASYVGNRVVAIDFGTYINPTRNPIVLELKPIKSGSNFLQYKLFSLVRVANKNLMAKSYYPYTGTISLTLSNDKVIDCNYTVNEDRSYTFSIPNIALYPNETVKTRAGKLLDYGDDRNPQTGSIQSNNMSLAGLSLKTTGNTQYIKVEYEATIRSGDGSHEIWLRILAGAPLSEIDGATIYPQLMFEDVPNTAYKEPVTVKNLGTRDIYSNYLYHCDIDLSTGKVYKSWKFIQSYQGETLPGEWVSNQDEYVEGTTPTIGARVYYKLEIPEETDITITPFSLPDDDIRYVLVYAQNSYNGSVRNISAYTKLPKPEEDPDELVFDDEPTSGSLNPVTSNGIYEALATKQDTLTFDSTPTENSTNPVTSGGVYDAIQSGSGSPAWGDITGTLSNQTDLSTALATKQDTLTFDSTPTTSSTNPVTSGGVKTALDTKQNTLTFDNAPTANSTNPVKSGGIKTAIDNLQDQIDDIVTTGGGIPEAPQDGKMYVRKDGQWVSIEFN